MALPLPAGWTTLQFNDWFNAIHQQALDLRMTNILSRVQAPVMVNAIEYLATGSTSTPLPSGWSALEFTDYMTAIINNANFEYYIWLLGSTPTNLQPNVKERTNYGITPPAPTVISFMAATVPAPAVLTRASAGLSFGSSGVLASFATDVARFAYNTTTLALLGLLNEQAVTNGVRNNTGTGVAAGTPGTQPTNWQGFGAANGLTRTIVGSGTEDGIPYVDFRYFGTPTASANFTFSAETTNVIAALAGQTWIDSAFLRIVGGTTANVVFQQTILPRDSGGTGIGSAFSRTIVPTTAALRTQRFSLGALFTAPTTAFASSRFVFAYLLNQPVDVTFRFGGQMLNQMPRTTDTSAPIITTAGTVTRAADILTIPETGLQAGFWDITTVRASGTTVVTQDLTAGGGTTFVVPTDPSAVQSVKFSMSL